MCFNWCHVCVQGTSHAIYFFVIKLILQLVHLWLSLCFPILHFIHYGIHFFHSWYGLWCRLNFLQTFLMLRLKPRSAITLFIFLTLAIHCGYVNCLLLHLFLLVIFLFFQKSNKALFPKLLGGMGLIHLQCLNLLLAYWVDKSFFNSYVVTTLHLS